MAVKITIDRLDEITASVRFLTSQEVLVGIPESTTDRPDEPEITNAEIGYLMENGVPEHNVPARPWLGPGVANYRDRAIQRLQRAGTAALDGRLDAVSAQYQAMGLEAVSSVRNKISEGPFTPLAPSTIAARQRADLSQLDELYKHKLISSELHSLLTGTQPLVDTGRFRQSVTFVVRRKVRG